MIVKGSPSLSGRTIHKRVLKRVSLTLADEAGREEGVGGGGGGTGQFSCLLHISKRFITLKSGRSRPVKASAALCTTGSVHDSDEPRQVSEVTEVERLRWQQGDSRCEDRRSEEGDVERTVGDERQGREEKERLRTETSTRTCNQIEIESPVSPASSPAMRKHWISIIRLWTNRCHLSRTRK